MRHKKNPVDSDKEEDPTDKGSKSMLRDTKAAKLNNIPRVVAEPGSEKEEGELSDSDEDMELHKPTIKEAWALT